MYNFSVIEYTQLRSGVDIEIVDHLEPKIINGTPEIQGSNRLEDPSKVNEYL
jgi:hypothetical protein